MKSPISNKNIALNNILEPNQKKWQFFGQLKDYYLKKCLTCQEKDDCQVYIYQNVLICETYIKQLEKNISLTKKEPNSQSPVKEFLLTRSRLLEFDRKEQTKKGLNQREQAQQTRIYELRDKVFSQIRAAIAKYYETAINGDYRFDGMPEIQHGISGWAEAKIWSLLVAIGEPNHWHVNPDPTYWEEAI